MSVDRTILDSFNADRASGQVIGSKTASGAIRKGIDVEQQIAIDHGALRIRPLVKPGWARQGIAYGPYTRANGLALSVFLLNGHNTSQSGSILQNLKIRWLSWALGLPSEGRVRWRLLRRFAQWLGSGRLTGIIRKMQCWAASTPERFQPPELNENLAVGWFPHEVPVDPLSEGNALIIHATGEENGELWTRVHNQLQSAFKGLQNLQTYYVLMLREQGAVYYAASVPQAFGFAAYPMMRPVAIDSLSQDKSVYAAVYQSVLGQIGFMVDTRVYGVQVELLPKFATWYGTAHAADLLTGEADLNHSVAEAGGRWTVYQGSGERSVAGARLTAANSLAILNPNQPSGLIHTLLTTAETITPIQLIWRFQDQQHFWSLQLSQAGGQLLLCEAGIEQTIATLPQAILQPNTRHSLQVLDDGQTFSLYLDGKLLFDRSFSGERLQTATGVGLAAPEASSTLFHQFEAHPRQISIPAELDLGAPWTRTGKEKQIVDTFETIGDLNGQKTNVGNQIWRKEMGKGTIECIGNNTAKVRASVQNPNPNRTVYTVAWSHSQFADVQVEITPPGTKRGENEEGRAGLIFWQDQNNYMIVNNWLNNEYGGASISSFFMLRGFEDLYDAVWTNIGSRIHWGVPHNFRVVFDGMHYTALINDEPVLYRCLTDVYPHASRLAINRVGIVANWEWGDDTGSQFRNFVAKA